MLDSDLAEIYGTTTKRLNEQVKRNKDRFPPAFMFQLSYQEFADLKSQFATSRSWGGRRKPPNVFTEHGTIMLASIINTPVAIIASVEVVNTYVRLREMLLSHKDLAHKLATLEKKYDAQFKVVFSSIRELMKPVQPRKKRKLGFHSE